MIRQRNVLGVDPAFRRTGWALLRLDEAESPTLLASGFIVPNGNTLPEKLRSIEAQFTKVLQARKPYLVLFEKPGIWMRRAGSSRHSVEMMAMARGVMLCACAKIGVPSHEIDFHTVRLVLLGRPNATKTCSAGLLDHLGLTPPRRARGGIDLDVADAMLVALYGIIGPPTDI